jgi:hypothetical protein
MINGTPGEREALPNSDQVTLGRMPGNMTERAPQEIICLICRSRGAEEPADSLVLKPRRKHVDGRGD